MQVTLYIIDVKCGNKTTKTKFSNKIGKTKVEIITD